MPWEMLMIARTREEFLGWARILWPFLTAEGQRRFSAHTLTLELRAFQPGRDGK